MRLVVDGGAVVWGAEEAATAAAVAVDVAAQLGRVVAPPPRLDPAPGREAAAGLTELTGVCQAVLELVALDLQALSDRMRRAAATYVALERGVVAAATSGRWGPVAR